MKMQARSRVATSTLMGDGPGPTARPRLRRARTTPIVALASFLTVRSALANEQQHPLDHAVEMLAKLRAEAVKDMHDEEVLFATYRQYAGDEILRLNVSARDLGLAVEAGGAEAAKLRSEADTLDLKINETATDLQASKDEKHEVDEENSVRASAFLQSETDYRNAIYMVEKAIAHLKAREKTDTAQIKIKYDSDEPQPPTSGASSLLQTDEMPPARASLLQLVLGITPSSSWEEQHAGTRSSSTGTTPSSTLAVASTTGVGVTTRISSSLMNFLEGVVLGPVERTSTWFATASDAVAPNNASSTSSTDLPSTKSEQKLMSLMQEASAKNFTNTGGVLITLRDLRASFADELDSIVKQEAADKLAWQQRSLTLGFTIKGLQSCIKTDTANAGSFRATAGDRAAQAVEDAQTKGRTETAFAELQLQLETKTSQFEERQKVRSNEIAALEDAERILSGPLSTKTVLIAKTGGTKRMKTNSNNIKLDLHGTRTTSRIIRLPNTPVLAFLQVGSSTSSSSGTGSSALTSLVQQRVEQQIQHLLSSSSRPVMSPYVRLLEKVRQTLAQDPLAKVKTMIRELVTRLEAEAAEEATHHSWCQTELNKTETDRDTAKDQVESYSDSIAMLQSDIERLEAKVPKILAKINTTQSEITEQTKMQADSSALLATEIAETTEAEGALASALQVLRHVYPSSNAPDTMASITASSTAPPISFLAVGAESGIKQKKMNMYNMQLQSQYQRQQPEEPLVREAPVEIFDDAPYVGQRGGGGAVEFLEFLQAGYKKQHAELVKEQTGAASEFQLLMQELQSVVTGLQSDLAENSATHMTKQGELSGAQSGKTSADAALSAALAYYNKLTPSCIAATDVDERSKQRQETIESLEEAVKILGDM
ncbi:unnamed protein product [Amoebophrya sp. A25]|nr:unnamed protein product [Amoebophrya sp. A25]|eukprot:GSA25T00004487001.1